MVGRGQGARILIVEDDLVLAELMANVLLDAGYTPEVATSPEAVRGEFDLVVTDYLDASFKPGQPWPYLSRLRSLCRGPILGCTGHSDALGAPLSTLGVSAVAIKPFDVDDLVQQVDDLLTASAMPGARLRVSAAP